MRMFVLLGISLVLSTAAQAQPATTAPVAIEPSASSSPQPSPSPSPEPAGSADKSEAKDSVAGVVTTKDGSPIAGAQVTVTSHPAMIGAGAAVLLGQTTTDGAGHFEVPGLKKGQPVRYAVSKDGYSQDNGEAKVGEGSSHLSIVLQPSAPSQ